MSVQNPNVPSFHGQCLTFCPKPSEVNGKNQEQKSLKPVPVVQGMFGLTQGAEEIASYEKHTKQKHPFIQPTGHASGQ